jgi:DeoR/GlpR family transcriptional regulator of sugar metabolism
VPAPESTPYRPPAEQTIRRVWQYVSLHPHATLGEIASGVQRSTNCTWRALNELERRGVLSRTKGQTRSIVVLEPWCWFDG